MSLTPPASALVIDDALTDLLHRAAGAEVLGPGRRVAPRRVFEVGMAVQDTRVFALPRAQFELQHQGFTLDDLSVAGLTGVAEVHAAGACAAMSGTWQPVSELSRGDALAFVASRTEARGPIILYLSGLGPGAPAPRDWPPRAMRGFEQHMYDLRREADRRALQTDIAADRAPASNLIFTSDIVTRLELWRVPDAPLILAVALGHAPTAVIARDRTAGEVGVSLCPSSDHPVARLTVPE